MADGGANDDEDDDVLARRMAELRAELLCRMLVAEVDDLAKVEVTWTKLKNIYVGKLLEARAHWTDETADAVRAVLDVNERLDRDLRIISLRHHRQALDERIREIHALYIRARNTLATHATGAQSSTLRATG